MVTNEGIYFHSKANDELTVTQFQAALHSDMNLKKVLA